MSNFAPVSKRHLHNGLIAMRVSDFLEGDKGKYQSGQMGQTVNLLAYAFGGSNPSLPTQWRSFRNESCAIEFFRRILYNNQSFGFTP